MDSRRHSPCPLSRECCRQSRTPLKWQVDKSLFPKACGVIANEHLIYSIDQSGWPVRIDKTRQLFLDDYRLASLNSVHRSVSSARKHSSNPLIDCDGPWEGQGPVFHTVIHDAENNKFRMWYCGNRNFVLPSGTGVRWPTCYAESDDGITWKKPALNLFEFEGSSANNIVILIGGAFSVIHDIHEPNSDRRYEAVVWHD